MITIESLIAVLFKVILLVTANPDIPQDVKDNIVAQITQTISQENNVVAPVSTPVVNEPVVPVTSGSTPENVIITPMNATIGDLTKENGVRSLIVDIGTAHSVDFQRICKTPKDRKDVNVEELNYGSRTGTKIFSTQNIWGEIPEKYFPLDCAVNITFYDEQGKTLGWQDKQFLVE